MVPILIVDDAREDLLLAQRVLSANKILNPIYPLSSGSECLDYFAGRGFNTRQLPCIVLLDMIMSPISGLDLLRTLKESPAAAGSIFIMLSGLTDIKMISEGYRLGASTFLIKPLVAEELGQMLGSVHGLSLTKTPSGSFVSIAARGNAGASAAEQQRRSPPPAA